jgi:hypothetical protein
MANVRKNRVRWRFVEGSFRGRSWFVWDIFLRKTLCFVWLTGIVSIFFTFCDWSALRARVADRGASAANCAFGNMAGYSMDQGAISFALRSYRICLFCLV